MIILAVGGQGGFAWERYELKTKFTNVQGLKAGAVVRVAGVDVGKVTAWISSARKCRSRWK